MPNAIPAAAGTAGTTPTAAGTAGATPTGDGTAGATPTGDDVAGRIARRTLADRGAGYAAEVRALLDAGLAVMRRCGTEARPRVADIVAEAGLSNDAFYRHFHGKDDLVVAILEDGTTRLVGYLTHQMAKEATAEGRVRRWVAGVMAQAGEDVAATTLAVLWNGGGVGSGLAAGRHFATGPLAALLQEPFAELGSTDAEGDARLAAHATLGTLSDHLWQRTTPTGADVAALTAFCLRVARPGPAISSTGRAISSTGRARAPRPRGDVGGGARGPALPEGVAPPPPG